MFNSFLNTFDATCNNINKGICKTVLLVIEDDSSEAAGLARDLFQMKLDECNLSPVQRRQVEINNMKELMIQLREVEGPVERVLIKILETKITYLSR